MLGLSFWLLCGASLLGCGLLVLYLRGPTAPPPRVAWRAVHVAAGIASLAALLMALRQGLPPTGMGTAGFGMAAAIVLVAALACGLLIARSEWQRRRPVELLVGLHAGIAITGLCLLLTLVAVG